MKKLTYEYVKDYIENEGYTLLSKEYINSKEKLTLKCNKGHQYNIDFPHFKRGQRCSICNGGIKLTYEYVKSFIENTDNILLSNEYVNAHSKLEILCPIGHNYKSIFNNFQQGRRCPECKNIKLHNDRKLTYEYVKEYIEKECYKLLSEKYVNNNVKIKIKCPNNHIFEMRFGDFQQGQRCPKCNKTGRNFSNIEKEVVNYVKTIYNGNIIENDKKTILNPNTKRYMELDIYLPDIKKAIEINGERWHNRNDSIIRDKIKNEQCKINNIYLMVLYYKKDLTNKRDIIISKNKIRDFIYEK